MRKAGKRAESSYLDFHRVGVHKALTWIDVGPFFQRPYRPRSFERGIDQKDRVRLIIPVRENLRNSDADCVGSPQGHVVEFEDEHGLSALLLVLRQFWAFLFERFPRALDAAALQVFGNEARDR